MTSSARHGGRSLVDFFGLRIDGIEIWCQGLRALDWDFLGFLLGKLGS